MAERMKKTRLSFRKSRWQRSDANGIKPDYNNAFTVLGVLLTDNGLLKITNDKEEPVSYFVNIQSGKDEPVQAFYSFYTHGCPKRLRVRN